MTMTWTHEELKQLLPHRDPMLLLDSVTLDDEGVAHGTLQLRGDEYFFQGHFPGNPLLPGVIQCEILAQTCCVLMGSGGLDKGAADKGAGSISCSSEGEGARSRTRATPSPPTCVSPDKMDPAPLSDLPVGGEGLVRVREQVPSPSELSVTPVYTGLNNVKFRRPVRPGELFETTVRLTRQRGQFFWGAGEGRVAGELCVQAEFSFALVPTDEGGERP